MKCVKNFVAAGFLSLVASSVYAAPINLSSWSALTLDFAGGQPAGNWVLDGSNTAVTQTVNADPSFFLNNLNQTSYSMDGTWQVVNDGGDDDYMGFAFGYQNSSNFYLFDWKKGTQNYSGANANEGMSVKKFDGAGNNGLVDLSLGEFWNNTAATFGDMSVLATNHSSTAGWVTGKIYNFHLDFNLTPGDIHINVKDGATTLWDVSLNDTTFTAGQFGFYNYSQQTVKYAGFEQTGGTIIDVPEPASVLLMSAGLVALGARRRITK